MTFGRTVVAVMVGVVAAGVALAVLGKVLGAI